MARQTNVGRMSFSTRPELRGTFGMVASTHWLASAAGMAVLEQGGNAFDAAVATGFTLQVVEPHLNGPGGDLPALLWPAGRERPLVLCAQGPAPPAATIERYRDELGLELVPGTGPLAAVVPGAFGGWIAMLREHGTLPLRDVLQLRDRLRRERAIRSCRPSATGSAASSSSSATTGRRASTSTSRSPSRARCIGTPRSPPPIAASSRRPKPPRATATPSSTPPTTAGIGASSPRSSSPSRSGSGSTARASATPACSARTTCATGRRRGRSRSRSTTTATRSSRPARGARRRSCSSSSACSRASTSTAWPGGRGVGAHDHRVREARLRRPGSLVRRPGLHGRAARRPAVPGVRGGAPRAARRGGLGRATSRLARRLRAAPAAAGRRSTDRARCRRADARRHGPPRRRRPPREHGLGDAERRLALGRARHPVARLLPRHARADVLARGRPAELARAGQASPHDALADARRAQRGVAPRARHAGRRPAGPVDAACLPRHVHHGLDLQAAIDAPNHHTEAFPSSFYPRETLPRHVAVEDRAGRETIEGLRRRGHEVEESGPWTLGRVTAVGREPGGILKAGANPRGRQGYAAGR